jgi:uncharacterized protein YecT (DUF1311 family)
MARITFTNRSIRTTVGTVTFAIAASLALGACGSSTDGSLTPLGSTSPSSSSAPDTMEAKKETKKVERVSDVKKTDTESKKAPRSTGVAQEQSDDLKYVKIVEPFGTPGRCKEDGTTIEMTACILKKVVDVDYTVDVLQRQRFGYAPSLADRKAALRNDANWLAKRTKTCSANPSGGSMDQITQAACLLKVSKARVASLS